MPEEKRKVGLRVDAAEGRGRTQRRFRNFLELARVLMRRCGFRPELELNHLLECLATGWGGREESYSLVRRRWLEFLDHGAAARGHSFSLFIATPYCASKCDYCRHFRAVPGRGDLREYVRRLRAQIEFYAPVFRRIVFRHVYFGGGTPSLFDEASLRDICAAFKRHIRFEEGNEATVEVNPASVSPAKIRSLRACGFNRLSIGVQSLDQAVLGRVNRERQSFGLVRAALAAGREAGFARINLDLIVGLPGGGPAFLSSFKRAAELRPDTIHVYPCEPTGEFLAGHYGGSVEAFDADIAGQKRYLLAAAAWAARNGFVSSFRAKMAAGRLLRSLPCVEFRRKGSAPMKEYDYGKNEGVKSVFGLGHHSNSYIYGKFRYHSLPLAAIPSRGACRGSGFSVENEMQAHILEQFARWKPVSLERFRTVFGVPAERRFAAAFSGLAALGKLRRLRGTVSLLYDDPAERLACAMFFLGSRQLALLYGAANAALGRAALRLRAGKIEWEARVEFSSRRGGEPALVSSRLPGDDLSARADALCSAAFRSALARGGTGGEDLLDCGAAALGAALSVVNRGLKRDIFSMKKTGEIPGEV